MSVGDIEEEKLIWDEYKYRHTHIWRTVFSLTGAMIILSIVPYVNIKLICELPYPTGCVFIIPPIIGMGLWLLGFLRIKKEMKLLKKVKKLHRKRQKELFKFEFKKNNDFKEHVNHYLIIFLGLYCIHTIVVAFWVITYILCCSTRIPN